MAAFFSEIGSWFYSCFSACPTQCCKVCCLDNCANNEQTVALAHKAMDSWTSFSWEAPWQELARYKTLTPRSGLVIDAKKCLKAREDYGIIVRAAQLKDPKAQGVIEAISKLSNRNFLTEERQHQRMVSENIYRPERMAREEHDKKVADNPVYGEASKQTALLAKQTALLERIAVLG